jgi:Transposase zinc-ribbon domain
MPRNQVQVQKGLNFIEFNRRYGREEQCHAALIAMRWPDGFVCPEITTKRIRRGTFTSVGDLIAAIRDYLDRHNAAPKPFRWHKTAAAILEKERRALNKLDTIKTGCQALESGH